MEETVSRAAADDKGGLSIDDDTGEGELIIGFVAPTGTDSRKVHRVITHVLAAYGYTHRDHHLSKMFSDVRVEALIGVQADNSNEYNRIKSAMDGGDAIRSLAQQAEAVALYACALIAKSREDASGNGSDSTSDPRPMPRMAHIIHSLKRPEEAVCLRRIYGSRFLLISIYTPREQRKLNLQERGLTEIQAVELISRDETGEPRSSGIAPQFTQATAKTFHTADLFIDGSRGDDEMHLALYRSSTSSSAVPW